MDGRIGGILLLDKETQTLSYRVHRGLSARYVEEVHLGLGEGIAGRVAQKRQVNPLGGYLYRPARCVSGPGKQRGFEGIHQRSPPVER